MFGWKKKFLRLNLSTSRIDSYAAEESLLKKYIGGRGIGTKIVYDNGKVDALSPDNLLVFAAGPLTGTSTPASGRFSLSTKSPLTGAVLDSNCGGTFGPSMKKAGYDALIIEGKAPEPVFIEIRDGDVEIKNASTLWGKNTKEAFNALKGKGSVVCIGRAGENLVRLSSIMSDGVHTFGRGGTGAVMGSKNLKAITLKGSGKVEIFDPEEFVIQADSVKRLLIACTTINKGLSVFGTPFLVKITEWMGILPAANFRGTDFDSSSLFAKRIMEKYSPLKKACYSCPIACKREEQNRKELPEYETIAMLGPNLMNGDYESIVEANRLCNDYGLDTISVGGTLGAYFEHRGRVISPQELVELVKKIGEAKGIGKNLGQGSKSFSGSEGSPELAMQVKGLELPGYDPRGVKGLGFSYATSNRGGCHTRAYLVAPEILRKPKAIDPYTLAGKAGHTKIFQDRFAAIDSLVVCKFAFFGAGEEEYAGVLSAVTGVRYSPEDLMLAGERIWNLEKLYNLREGFEKSSDTLPDRFFSEGLKGKRIDREEFLKTLEEYYRMRGWDENGIPSKQKLTQLGV
jgi:aldehyde:ferredoxin oxidoreductase